MTKIVWITGRAATGKTTLIIEIEARLRSLGYTVHRLCDEDILFTLKAADTGHEHHWHADGDPARFRLRSGHLFDEGLRAISADLVKLLNSDRNVIAVVELARGRAEPIDVSYRRALDLIDPRLWACSSVFRLELPFASQATRNEHRAAMGGRTTPQDTLHDLYRDDDPEIFLRAGIWITNLQADTDPSANAAAVLRIAHLTP